MIVDGINLAVNLGGLRMQTPITDASGTFASGKEYSNFTSVARMGAITTKGVSLHGWQGNEPVRIAETPSGMLNSIGLQNPGVQHLCKYDLPWIKEQNILAIVNVSGHSFDEYEQVIEALEEDGKTDAYELNISCPNVDAGGMTFGTTCVDAARVVSACRKYTDKPLIVKLSPNVTDISEIARAVEAAGADAISLINTLLGMAINAQTRRPELARIVGGLSGPAIKPVALRMVYECYKSIKIPILGMGGITSGEDAIEFMLAGATAVAVGTANFSNPHAIDDVLDGMITYCKEQGVEDISTLIGGLVC